MDDFILIKNARTNNLKSVSVGIPKHKIVAVTGISGSGKSSLVLDTIASQAQRLLNETYSSYVQNLLTKYKRPVVDSISNLPVCLVINQKRIQGNSRSTVGTVTGINSSVRLLFSRIAVPFVGYSMKYSFNNPEGMCKTCKGLGQVSSIDVGALIDFEKSLNGNAIQFPTFQKAGWRLTRYTESGFFDNDKKIGDYSKDELDLLLYSPKRKPNNPSKKWHKTANYLGVIPRIMETFVNVETRRYKKELDQILTTKICPSCHGTRLREEVLAAKIQGKSIADCYEMPIPELLDFVSNIRDPGVELIIKELKKELESLSILGLDYLTLSRPTNTLSGGESQRIKMTKYLNSSLSDVLYIFDEPSTGLHPEDIKGINHILQEIRYKGNSVIFIEHDPDMIAIADEVINFGEGAGSAGGKITFQGTYKELLKSDTVTGRVLRKEHRLNTKRKEFTAYYKLNNVTKNNIKNVSVKVPKQALTIVTGLAGSGKSTLVRQVFKKHYPEFILLDQSLPQASSRSNLMTYLNIFGEIRKIFGRENHVDVSTFSVTGKGACPVCKGKGFIKLDLAYLGESKQECEKCQGKRFNDKTLSYLYRDKNIGDIFDLTAIEAMEVFYDNPKIKDALESLIKANLSYVKLGQNLDTFSGGELQRLKIAHMLSEKSGESIILDEPTTGLHESDIDNLMKLFQTLIVYGHTLLVIEHNLSLISQADWIIDLGPRGGNSGGQLLFQGYPADFINCKNSYTAGHLRRFLKPK